MRQLRLSEGSAYGATGLSHVACPFVSSGSTSHE
jgi:hypothetical protein